MLNKDYPGTESFTITFTGISQRDSDIRHKIS